MNIYIYCIFSSTLIRCRHTLLNIGAYILLKSNTAMPLEVLWRLQNARQPSPECNPLTFAVCSRPERCRRRHLEGGNSRTSGIYGGDIAPKCFYRMTYHNRVVFWHVRRGGTRLRDVGPLKDGAAAGLRRKETDASGLHGGDVAVGLARMLLPGVPLC